MSRLLIVLLATFALTTPVLAADSKTPPTTPRYTFSWPLTGDAALQPRGGSTQGAEVAIDTAPSSAWQALQQAGLSQSERDRRAILSMAGSYRVTFDFLEIIESQLSFGIEIVIKTVVHNRADGHFHILK